MSNASSSLSMNGAIWIMVVYVLVYYFLARSVLARINRTYPGYFEVGKADGDLPFGRKTSSAIWEMIFDGDLPDDQCGQFIRIGLYAVRVMFACYLPLFGLMLYLAWQ